MWFLNYRKGKEKGKTTARTNHKSIRINLSYMRGKVWWSIHIWKETVREGMSGRERRAKSRKNCKTVKMRDWLDEMNSMRGWSGTRRKREIKAWPKETVGNYKRKWYIKESSIRKAEEKFIGLKRREQEKSGLFGKLFRKKNHEKKTKINSANEGVTKGMYGECLE